MNTIYKDKPWINKYDKDVKSSIDMKKHSVHYFLENAAMKYPDHSAIIYKGNKITYHQLNEMSDALSKALICDGFQKKDKAVIYMPNTIQFVVAFFGILKAGGIVIATNPLYSEYELEHQLSDCGAETVFVLSLFYNTFKKVQKKGNVNIKRVIVASIKDYLPIHLKLLFTFFKEKKEGHRIVLEPGDIRFVDFLYSGYRSSENNAAVTADDIALFQYTGGTTGLAKGAMALHQNLVANIYMLHAWLNCEKKKEVVLGAVPFFHSYGMISAMLLSVSFAATLLIIPNPRDLKDVLGSISKYKATLFPGVPAMYTAINSDSKMAAGKYDLSSIKICVSGSAPLLDETKRKFEELTKGRLVEGFGLTEAHVVTHINPIAGENRLGSIGLPLPNVECHIVDSDTGIKQMPVGKAGEMVIKSPSIMPGYWNMVSETKKVLSDGWLYTGDIARMDEDGYFFIEDRKKDMIIAGGYNIYPREIEEVLAHHPAIMEVSVAGIFDEKRGETVKAWIVKQPGKKITEKAIINWSKDRLAKYKYPRIIEFIDTLPKNTVGKVLKRELIKKETKNIQKEN